MSSHSFLSPLYRTIKKARGRTIYRPLPQTQRGRWSATNPCHGIHKRDGSSYCLEKQVQSRTRLRRLANSHKGRSGDFQITRNKKTSFNSFRGSLPTRKKRASEREQKGGWPGSKESVWSKEGRLIRLYDNESYSIKSESPCSFWLVRNRFRRIPHRGRGRCFRKEE